MPKMYVNPSVEYVSEHQGDHHFMVEILPQHREIYYRSSGRESGGDVRREWVDRTEGIVNLLLQKGASLDILDTYGGPPVDLHDHFQKNKSLIYITLLKMRNKKLASIYSYLKPIVALTSYGPTVLHIACLHRQLRIASDLLNENADVNAEDVCKSICGICE